MYPTVKFRPKSKRAWLLALLTSVSVPQTVQSQIRVSRVTDTTRFNIRIHPSTTDGPFALIAELEIPRTRDSITTLQLPDEWAGRRNLQRSIIGLEAISPGATLLQSTDSTHARVRSPIGTPLIVRWRLRETLPSSSAPDAHNHSEITKHWAQIVGHDSFVLPDIPASAPVHVMFTFGTASHAVIATSFGWPAANDSVIIARGVRGDIEHAVYTFAIEPASIRSYKLAVPGGLLYLIVRGHLAIPDTAIGAAVQRVVATERNFWGGKYSEKYVVTIGTSPRGSLAGTRLTNAFVADLDSTRTMDEQISLLFAHELMHEWIGNTIHPQDNVPDGSLGWFHEGFTDYMAHLLMWRSGLLSDSVYIATVNQALSSHAMSIARDSSWSSVVSGFWKNSELQREPYLRGELLALKLDAEARRTSNNTRSMPLALKQLAQNKDYVPLGVTDGTLRAYFRRTLGAFADSIITSVVNGGPILLDADTFGKCASPMTESRVRWDPAFDVDSSLKARKIVGTSIDGTAYAQGLRDGQTITRASIYRGDPTKQIVLGVRDKDGDHIVEFVPAG